MAIKDEVEVYFLNKDGTKVACVPCDEEDLKRTVINWDDTKYSVDDVIITYGWTDSDGTEHYMEVKDWGENNDNTNL